MQTKFIPNTAFYSIIMVAVLACYYPIFQGVGFLSDDWLLLKRTATSQFWLPIEDHHWSLLINSLFHFSSHEWIGPEAFHLLALIGHAINCFFVFLIAQDQLSLTRSSAWATTALFALAPAGSEALIWCCAIGYIFCTTWILVSIYLYLDYLNNGHSETLRTTLLLLVVQAVALMTWDWGILITPTLIVIGMLYKSLCPLKQQTRILIPMTLLSLVILAIKKSFGLNLGYLFNSPIGITKTFAISPFIGILPQINKSFYTSPLGILIALSILVGFAVVGTKAPKARIPLVLFFLWQVPFAFFGHPQSRYFYLLAFPLALVLILSLTTFIRCDRWKMTAFVFLVTLSILGSWDRVNHWVEASQFSNHLVEKLSESIDRSDKQKILINLPINYASRDIIWKPFIWHVDIKNLIPNTTLINLDTINREKIVSEYPNSTVYEIITSPHSHLEKATIIQW